MVRARDPLDTDQTVVVAFKEENGLLYVRVPDENIVVKTSTQDQVIVGIPVQRLHARVVTLEGSTWFEILHAPQTDLAIEASRGEETEIRDRQQVHDGFGVEVVIVFLSRIVPFADAVLFQVLHVVGMDSSLQSSCE